MNILFVCTGNTCRSPMAEALLKHKFPEVNVKSAGVFAHNGERISQHAVDVLKERGVDANHVSQRVTPRLLQWADVVLMMTTGHKQALMMEYPNHQEKYFTLKEYVSEADKEVWGQLKKIYADFEIKRSKYIKENGRKLDQKILEENLSSLLEKELNEIRILERSLINYDISDPFGGSLSVYKKTLMELEENINLLIEKLEKSGDAYE